MISVLMNLYDFEGDDQNPFELMYEGVPKSVWTVLELSENSNEFREPYFLLSKEGRISYC